MKGSKNYTTISQQFQQTQTLNPQRKKFNESKARLLPPPQQEKRDNVPLWQQQGFAAGSAYHNFNEGCQRIHTLSIRYEKIAPEISHHFQVLKRCLEYLPLTLDSRRIGLEAEGVMEELEIDVEKTRKFGFLDLIIEMLLNEDELKGKEGMNVLLYTEVATKRFRKILQGNSKGKEVER